ncbi:caspase family protein [Bradyrhizobium sp. STM 3557]|uniref:caspase family protein n=1 Tax=Bradyrhizobium sp. STM 3557 TaxID=578920 RepID=UPI0038909E10
MISHILRSLFALLLLSVPLAAVANASESRLALVIGNATYKTGALATPANDAALVAQTLRMQGFDVTGSRDLDTKGLRQAFESFRNKVRAFGPGSVVVVYFAGLGLQVEGNNYLLPVDAVPTQTSDIRRDAVQLSGLTGSLAELGPKAAFVILDAARKNPFAIADGPLAAGFAWAEPETNFLVALSAAPGTIASDNSAGFGPYAVALAEMLGQDGLSAGDLFARVRLRVNETTNGGQVPWQNAKLENSFVFAERPSDAPQRTDAPELTRSFRTQPMRTLSAGDAYFTALLRDTFDGYSEFLAEYWKDPMTSRVRALLAVRREVLTWHRSTQKNNANAYWTYLERYPRGPHLADAQRWLTRAGAAAVPPATFARMECDVPSPLPDERQYVERTRLNLGDPDLAFEPLLPMPNYFLNASALEPPRLAVPVGPIGDHDLPALTSPFPAKSGAAVAAAPPLPREAEQLPQDYAKTGDAANSISAVPPSVRPAPWDPTAGATNATSPAVAAAPWIIGGPSYQSVAPAAGTPRQTTPPSASASSGKPVSDDARRPALGPSNRVPSLAARPLPSAGLTERAPQAARQAMQAAKPSVPRAGAAVANGPAAAPSAPGRAPPVPLRPSLEAPATASVPRPVSSGSVAAGTVPRGRPTASTGIPVVQPAKKPAAGAPAETPAAIPPAD